MTLADVIVSISLVEAFQTVLDVGFRKAMKELNDWAEKLYSHNDFKKYLVLLLYVASHSSQYVCLTQKNKKKRKQRQ